MEGKREREREREREGESNVWLQFPLVGYLCFDERGQIAQNEKLEGVKCLSQ